MTDTINRQDYRATACVDWVKVAVTLNSASQHRHVRAVLFDITGENLHADALDADSNAGGNATVFAITFHDRLANDLLALNDVLHRLRAVYGFTTEPTINAIEIAIDFYWKGSPETQQVGLLAMVYRLQSGLFVPNAIRPRQWVPNAIGTVRPDGKSGAYRFLDNAHERHRLDPNLSFRIGNRDDGLSWQTYFKQTDNNQTPIQDRTQWRARVEVTLKSDASRQFGLTNLSNLDGYDFQQLTKLFKFRRPMEINKQARKNHLVVRVTDPARYARALRITMHAIALNRRVHDATPARGMHTFDTIGHIDYRGRTHSESRHIEADPVLAGAVKGALRRLTLGESFQKKGTN